MPGTGYTGQGTLTGGYQNMSGSGSMSGTGSSSTKNTASGSSSGSNQIAAMSGTETGLTGSLANMGLNYMSPTTGGALGSLASLYQTGMQPTAQQQGGLKSIENSTLAADQQGLNFSMFGPGGWMNQINNNMADRGMTNSSVDTMAQTGAVENAQNLMNQDVQGANQQYQTGMLNLPFQNANLLSGLASLGLNVTGQNAGTMQSLLGLLTQRDMANNTQTQNFTNTSNQTQNWQNQQTNQSNSSGFNLGGGLGVLGGVAAGALLA